MPRRRTYFILAVLVLSGMVMSLWVISRLQYSMSMMEAEDDVQDRARVLRRGGVARVVDQLLEEARDLQRGVERHDGKGGKVGVADTVAYGPRLGTPRGEDNVSVESPSRNYLEVQIFYATDRKREAGAVPGKMFGPARGQLSVGTCVVSIPNSHRFGGLEGKRWYMGEFRVSPERHVMLQSVTPRPLEDFIARLRKSVRGSQAREAFVFIHGYNVTFEDAARRTAQIAYDLNFDGAPIMYSWPSRGKVRAYAADEATVEWTAPNLTRALQLVAEQSGASEVHVIAHSMGNRALAAALARMRTSGEEPPFNQVILTAPDIDADVFARDIVPAVRPRTERLTLYASSADKAIIASRRFHQAPRAGEGGVKLIVLKGLDTIDASGIDTDMIGHGYFAANALVLNDLFSLIKDKKPPGQRNLRRRQKDQLEYWELPRQ